MGNKITDILIDLKDNIDNLSGNDVLDIIVKKLNETPMEIAQNKLSDAIYVMMEVLMNSKSETNTEISYGKLKTVSNEVVNLWLNIKEMIEIKKLKNKMK